MQSIWQKHFPSYALRIENSPTSLQCLLLFYRILGFSYSGVTFTAKQNIKTGHFSAQQHFTKWTTLSLLAHLAGISIFVYRVGKDIITLTAEWSELTNTNTTTQTELSNSSFYEQFNANYKASLIRLKPILRGLMISLRYCYLLNLTHMYLWNVLFGGRVVQCLTTLQPERFDRNYNFMLNTLGKNVLLFLIIHIMSVFLFNYKTIETLQGIVFNMSIPKAELAQMRVVLFSTFFDLLHYTISTLIPITFSYSAYICKATIEDLECRISPNKLTPEKMANLVAIVRELTAHYGRLLRVLVLPLYIDLSANTIILIGATSSMIIGGATSNNGNVLMGEGFSAFMISLVRMAQLCSATDAPVEAYERLLFTTNEAVQKWDLSVWLNFTELQKLQGRFEAASVGPLSVKQSSILPIAGFVIGYVMVLFQTDNL